MKLPSDSITSNLLSYDPTLNELKDLFDYGYESIRKKFMELNNLLNYDTIPDELLDYILYSKGIPLYFNYSTTQKRSLLSSLTESVIAEEVGNSGSSIYEGTLEHFPVVPGSVSFHDGTYTATDSSHWNLRGTGISTGWINYNTGQYFLVFTSNTGGNVSVNYDYSFNLNSKRYTRLGLEEYVKKVVPADILNVDVFTQPKTQMFLEFRLYGFPNESMRETAGEYFGDQVGYIANIPQLDEILNTTTVLIYKTGALTADDFKLLKQTLFFELKNMDFTQDSKLQVMNAMTDDVDLVYSSPNHRITNSAGMNFTTLFASPGENFIGVKHSTLDRIKTYKIQTVESASSLLLDPNQDFIVESGMDAYSADLSEIGTIEL